MKKLVIYISTWILGRLDSVWKSKRRY